MISILQTMFKWPSMPFYYYCSTYSPLSHLERKPGTILNYIQLFIKFLFYYNLFFYFILSENFLYFCFRQNHMYMEIIIKFLEFMYLANVMHISNINLYKYISLHKIIYEFVLLLLFFLETFNIFLLENFKYSNIYVLYSVWSTIHHYFTMNSYKRNRIFLCM